MTQFLNYVFGEVKSGRLDKASARQLLAEFAAGHPREAAPAVAASATRPWSLLARWVPDERGNATQAWPRAEAAVMLVGGDADQRARIAARLPKAAALAAPADAEIDTLAAALGAGPRPEHVFWIAARGVAGVRDGDAVIAAQQHGVIALFRFCAAWLRAFGDDAPLGLTVVTEDVVAAGPDSIGDATHAGLHGLAGVLAKERPQWRLRVVDLDSRTDWPLDALLRLPADRDGNAVVHRDGVWHRQTLAVCELPAPERPAFRKGGVYVLIGGAGTVGQALSAYLIERYQAQVVWIGRRAPDAALHANLERLGASGPTPRYWRADAGDRAALTAAVREIREQVGEIHGVVHAAMTVRSGSLPALAEADFRAGYDAKLATGAQIAQAFGDRPLELVLFMSSIQSHERTVRQAAYAAGCVFADAWAEGLRRELGCAVKVMNWGYWAGAPREDAAALHAWLAARGFGLIEARAAMAALEALVAGPFDRLVHMNATAPTVLSGIAAPIERVALAAASAPAVLAELAPSTAARPAGVDPLAPAARAAAADFELWMLRLLRAQLKRAGLVGTDAQPARVAPLHARWLDESLRMLSAAPADPQAGDSADSLWQAWHVRQSAWRADPDLGPQLKLVDATLRALPEILAGRTPATSVIFPDASMRLLDGLYKGTPTADLFNATLAERVAAHVAACIALQPGIRLRILEIGAGTGGTTQGVLERLKPHARHIGEYCYTDLSKAFLFHGESTFGPQAPFLRTARFDVEQPLEGQAIEPGAYDIVLAANVLHATPDIRRTLRHTKAALKRHGALFVNELSARTLFSHLTFGLLEGWWKHDDTALRIPGSPGLSPQMWRHVLEAEGFRGVSFPAEAAHGLGQQIVVAQSDGVLYRSFDAAGEAPRDAATVQVTAARDTTATSQAVQAHVAAVIAGEVAAVLKLQPGEIDFEDAFADHGLDSILGVQAAAAIARALAIEFKVTTLFDHPSVNRLAAHLAATCGDVIGARLAPAGIDVPVDVSADGEALLQRARTVVVAQIAATLKLAPSEIDAEDAFADHGLDSILGVQAAAAIARELAIDLRVTALFDHPSVNRLSAHIAQTFGAALTAAPRVAAVAPDDVAPTGQPEPIAVIGMAARYPQSPTPGALWTHLANGDDLTTPVTRWSLAQDYARDGGGACLRGGFVDGIDEFDPVFFSISGTEAMYMDPQQRLFLQEAWHALEDAGYAGAAIRGRRCGVYVGHNGGDYRPLERETPPPQAMWGGAASILSARIAYYLDLQGPAITVDTACSSSLVALHLACQGLRNGDAEIAIAGGVYLYCTSDFYRAANRAGMLSATGHCHTFDARADGFVPGEGVGAVVLKPLRAALADGDHVHGVIAGSGINQDGATNGITAPSALSQERLERQVYDSFGIDAASISMVEAHGTGTQLGDPIEFRALTQAFRQDTDAKGYCALGSIKTNIGHTTAASGVAGVLKVLLSLRHRQIPPSLNFEQANPAIDLDSSPFYVNTALRDWTSPGGTPRRAAVSSFGFSGTNAHVVIDEAPEVERVAVVRPAYLFVLSARTAAQLEQQADQLIAHLSEGPGARQACIDISHTLLTGRRQMAHRLACVAANREELIERLSVWRRDGQSRMVFTGHVDEVPAAHEVAVDDIHQIAERFVQGHRIDAGRIFVGLDVARVPLPTYPFATDRYWVDVPAPAAAGVQLHPLVHRNTSTLAEQRFSSTFTGREFFLDEHIVKGRKVLPGVAHLELVRAAVELAVVSEAERSAFGLRNVVWARPIAVTTETAQVHVVLHADGTGALDYEIHGIDAGERVIHSRGSVLLGAAEETERVDLPAMRSACAQPLDIERFYASMVMRGLEHGTTYRTLESFAIGRDAAGRRIALARIALPPSRHDGAQAFGLHPGVIDGAAQAGLGLVLGADLAQSEAAGPGALKPSLPFGLEALDIAGPLPLQAWAVARETADSNETVRKVDIDLCDDEGRVVVRLRGFTARSFDDAAPAVSGEAILLVPDESSDALGEPLPAHRRVLLCGLGEAAGVARAAIEAGVPDAVCEMVETGDGDPAQRFAACVERVMSILQAIVAEASAEPVAIQVVVPATGEGATLNGLSGLLHTARLEHPKLVTSLVAVADPLAATELVERIRAGVATPPRFERAFPVVAEDAQVWRDGGVYLLTGGLGGLGKIFAREILAHTRGAVLVLTGRSRDGGAALTALRAEAAERGASLDYLSLDVSDATAVADAVQRIVSQHGRIHGVLHAAGVNDDGFLATRQPERMRAVLAPKTAGVVNLDAATRHLRLDLLLLFSSASAAVGNAGQADYTAANAFLDGYASYRNTLVAKGERSGRTVSIAWPLWAEGGMRPDAAAWREFEAQGVTPMSTETGLRVFHQALALQRERVLVLHGDWSLLQSRVSGRIAPAAAPEPVEDIAPPPAMAAGDLHDRVLAAVVHEVSQLLRVPASDLEPKAELSRFGFDSLSLTQLGSRLNRRFGLSLTPTVFFEHSTLQQVAAYLAKTHTAAMTAALGEPSSGAVQRAAPAVAERPAAPKRRALAPRAPVVQERLTADDPVAIVGISGHFPGARDLSTFWANLLAGHDAIGEVPLERWDWRALQGDSQEEPNRTNVKWGGFIDGLAEFDPLFFGISPREAEMMDPQQRLMLMHAWAAIEDAGHAPQSLAGTRTGVFVGTDDSGYNGLVSWAGMPVEMYSTTGAVSSLGTSRLSFLLDLHGPSEPIETACSSSLVAIHRAVRAIRHGECDAALVGGVNTIVNPAGHISFSRAGALSEDGRCKTFSKDANGYVRGEGVGMLLLKPLSAARRDGDHIYALVRGTHENHGGRANSLTAPNPNAQAELIAAAWKEAGIDPRTVGYIEAHGTGTPLGDPIEIDGLKRAFRTLYEQTGDTGDRGDRGVTQAHCGLGSVKTNIGHLELAAGVAGVIKVLLQMKHRTLAKSLHCEEVNPYIDLEDSPFRLIGETQPWVAPRDASGRELPRRAGVSSFGIGGVNAHVVLEAYEPDEAAAPSADKVSLIVLSAKTPERLTAQAAQLLAAVESGVHADADLPAIAYTLQVGRDAMEHRLGFTADSMAALARTLRACVAEENAPNVYRGDTRRGRDTLALLGNDAELQALIAGWIERRKFAQLLDLWTRGLAVDWPRLHAESGMAQPRRVSLPTYAFARDRHWIDTDAAALFLAAADGAMRGGARAMLHPLVHGNTSDVAQQRFASTFTGREFFFADHVVQRAKVLPGVAYLEMARAAAVHAYGETLDPGARLVLRRVVWSQPIALTDSGREVRIVFAPLDSGDLEFEVSSDGGANDGASRVVHCQGLIAIAIADEAEAPALDLAALRALCAQTIEVPAFYETFIARGVAHGPAYRGLASIALDADPSRPGLVVARLALPEAARATAGDYLLHPSMMDSAVQAALGLVLDGQLDAEDRARGVVRPSLPFALDALEVFGPTADCSWAVARDGMGSSAKVRKVDIDLCDEEGRVRASLVGLTPRAYEAAAPVDGEEKTLLVVPASVPANDGAWAARHVLLGGFGEAAGAYRAAIAGRIPGVVCEIVDAGEGSLAERYARCVENALALIRTLVASRPAGPTLVQWVTPAGGADGTFAGLSGLFATAALECPALRIGSLAVDAGADPASVAHRVSAAGATVPRYTLVDAPEDAAPVWRDEGVYLLTGGAGGLGRLFARDIASSVAGAKVVLTGRAARAEGLDELVSLYRARGGELRYVALDVSDGEAVAACVREIEDRYGRLNGVVHGAGILDDGLLSGKRAEGVRRVLAPKVAGAVNLDEATRHLCLDLFVLFSSAVGVVGNVGQSDYAAANAFLDRFAAYRDAQVKAGRRFGRTLSIDWPLWAEGGMRVGAEAQGRQRDKGFVPLPAAQGLEAFHRALASSETQVLVLHGEWPKLRALLPGIASATEAVQPVPPPTVTPVAPPPSSSPGALEDRIKRRLAQDVGELLKIETRQITLDTEFSQFGLDSVSLTLLANKLNRAYALSLTPTVFFEHSTVATLAHHFATEHRAHFEARLPGADQAARPAAAVAATAAAPRRAASRFTREAASTPAIAPEPIAIVGLHASFPQAPDLETFWSNLLAGRDSIVEIPPQRWDWRALFGNPQTEPNRTNVKWGGFLDDVDRFDPLFFGISPREAEMMDPQQRLLLMHAWAAIEDAGYAPRSLAGTRTGVFIGTTPSGYVDVLAEAGTPVDMYTMTGSVASMGTSRLSYLLDLHGPSEPIETACSSSLVAIHRAVRAIRAGECEMALVGGVNTIVHPAGHISFSRAGALAEDGRCKSFSKQANGYARGEGAGVMLLKPLSAAERDGDHIYGVIRGTNENHGGRANHLTAPNPKAQADLIHAAWRDAGIDPRTIGYIEAHGTGTSLGDPIEIDGLKRAFRKLYAESGDAAVTTAHCGLGSVKTNIGHLELAAGVAGVVKVLLQMKHRTLVKSLHCEEVNPYIDLSGSPFRLIGETQAWPALRDASGRELPRRAGVSSFGIGGVNAHVVLEEYVSPTVTSTLSGEPSLIVLSAKTPERLKAQAARLLSAVERGAYADGDLPAIGHTLRVGRDPMEHRLALLAASLDALSRQLHAWLDGDAGEVRVGHATDDGLHAEPGFAEQVDAWFAEGRLDALAAAWVRGAAIDWERAAPEGPTRRLALPTYAFAQDSYWPQRRAAPTPAPRHPLLHGTRPDPEGPSHVSTFHGREPFLDHHRVHGTPVMPGVAYLEMIRAAVAGTNRRVNRLEGVVWLRPLQVGPQPVSVTTTVRALGQDEFACRVQGTDAVHCEARARLGAPVPSRSVDLAALTALRRETFDVAAFHARFAALGLRYGATHRGLVSLSTGMKDGTPFVLAELSLVAGEAAMPDADALPPGLLDGAVQAALALAAGSRDDALALPFALDSVDLLAPVPARAIVVVTPGAGDSSGAVRRVDIAVCDIDGRVCVALNGLASRPVATQEKSPSPPPVVSAPSAAPEGTTDLREQVVALVKARIAGPLRLAAHLIEPAAALEKYGIDSVLAVEIVRALEEDFGHLPATLMFEHQTVDALVDHFVAEHRQTLELLLAAAPGLPPLEVGTSVPLDAPVPTAAPAPIDDTARDDIAIIGVAGRYPQADDLDAYWDNLREGRDCVTEIPATRWDHARYYDPEKGKPGHSYSKWGGFVRGVDEFDARFFNVAPGEARTMDPQERMFLQCAYATLEDAGYTRQALGRAAPEGVAGHVGVFVGVMYQEYQLYAAQAQAQGQAVIASGNPAAIPNRVSYFFNFNGPSIALDTMCSSSLTSIHLACQALQRGDCALALAGGVNASVHPNKYLMLSYGRFASSTGRCESFGEGGDGYVPGEGVGAVLLKPLSRAIADGDHIHAVIRGSSLNHGGKTNGFTVPNPAGQSGVISRALERAGIPARAVSYIEAHGTGTSLGDPIEIAALTRAFADPSSGAHACAIGSVKSNIGHCESAAGIAGITKVLLQMRHRELVPSLHSAVLNPHIDFARGPFTVQRERAAWVPPFEAGQDGRAWSRIAGVSSFGAGGSNAHVILEEYVRPVGKAVEGSALIVLSARNDAQLRERAAQLLAMLDRGGEPALDALAYTLQVGREAMDSRLAFVAASIEELASTLRRYLAGDTGRVRRADVKRDPESMAARRAAAALRVAVVDWLAAGDRDALLNAWVGGEDVDWTQLYPDHKPNRVSLPTYPFARERHWLDIQPAETPAAGEARLHPLVHRNTSTLTVARFTSRLAPTDAQVVDHRVNGELMLPGAAYLEVARAATALLADAAPVAIERVVWLRPLTVGSAGTDFDVVLQRESDENIGWRVETGEGAARVVHAQGSVRTGQSAPAPARVDLDALRTRGTQQWTPDACYEAFASMGLGYGPRHRVIERLAAGVDADGARYALARLVLAEPVDAALGLQPALIDGAFQSALGLVLGAGAAVAPAVPFALARVEWFGACPSRGWAVVREAERAGGDVQRLDIVVCDDEGNVRVAMQGFASRTPKRADEGIAGERTLASRRREREAALATAGTVAAPVAHRVLLTADLAHRSAAAFGAAPGIELVPVHAAGSTLAERVSAFALEVLAQIQSVLVAHRSGRIALQVALEPNEADAPFLAAVSALLRTARLEAPRLDAQLVVIDRDPAVLRTLLEREATAAFEPEVRYEGARRFVTAFDELPLAPATPAWKDGGVYLITGGLGGLGRIFARDIAAHARGARIVLTGRAPQVGEAFEALCRDLAASGAELSYRALDLTDATDVAACVREIVARHGALHGVLHAAGQTDDGPLAGKRAERVRTVLAPKLAGTVHLDEATRNLPLDLFVLFASAAGVLGNPGQADYAAANAFMDRYAAWRADRVVAGERSGRTVSAAWPLWADGGMQVGANALARMRAGGLAPLPSANALDVFHRVLASSETHVLVLHGDASVLQAYLAAPKEEVKAPDAVIVEAPVATQADAAQALRDALVQEVAAVLSVSTGDVHVDAEFSEFGFDSISLTEFGSRFNARYGTVLTPAIFFEYPTIRRFADHLVASDPARFAVVVPSRVEAPAAVTAPAIEPVPAPAPASDAPDPIAIVGISGRFPQAADPAAFWRNLEAGRDCIGEIPAGRWDWRALHGDPQTESNRTNVKWGGFIDGVENFDPYFFGISPREAEVMDPQQRLMLMYAWAAIEDAGHAPQSLAGTRTGVFVGTASSGYTDLIARAGLPIEGYSSTGAVSSIGPNRLSYMLNLRGPSEPIETACSSSLVAIHRAVRSIRQGECEMAIAGGVNTIVSPAGHISFGKAGMLCEDGRCKTFSKEANGYVRGEGVGMLLLKTLSVAERDGDHVYAVIRGTHENHGGRANSLTAPNPSAQAELIVAAWQEAGIDPRTIGYIEAHGTGTPLGDPVEINGLKSAFRTLYAQSGGATVEAPHCAIGSVKTNIGHLELAAGIAGVVKVLLQMKHRTLAKSLHCAEVNPYIDLEGSPFRLIDQTQPWPAPRDAAGRELPRRAGVSSFGFGGVNVHVVLEEHLPRARPSASSGPALIVLSAKTPERLVAQAAQLLEAIEEGAYSDADLPSIGYTLQMGRDAMEHRLGFRAVSIVALKRALRAASRQGDEAGAPALHRGEAPRHRAPIGESERAAVRAWIAGGREDELLAAWVGGFEADWSLLYPGTHPARLALPTYPFASERHWVDVDWSAPGQTAKQLHPLVHANTSTLLTQRFSSQFSGTEPLFADHRVDGRPVLPGAAYLEMARAALAQALRDDPRAGNAAMQLDAVLWSRPLTGAQVQAPVDIVLRREDGGGIGWAVSQGEGEGQVVYAEGRAGFADEAGEAPRLDLARLRAGCDAQRDADDCYSAFEDAGLVYGASHRTLESLGVASGGRYALARLVGSDARGQMLPPGFLDGAFQAALGLMTDSPAQAARPFVPFALDRITIHGACPERGWAHVREADGKEERAAGGIRRLDIDLCDDDGRVVAALRGFALRAIARADRASIPEAMGHRADETMLLIPTGTRAPSNSADERNAVHHVLFCGFGAATTGHMDAVRAALPAARCTTLDLGEGNAARRYEQGATALLTALRTIGAARLSLVVPVGSMLSGLVGALHAAAAESRSLRAELVEIASDTSPASLVERLTAAPQDGDPRVERAARTAPEPIWRDGGVYLVTGGLGGLGRLFAHDILEKTQRAQLILTGRSTPDREALRALSEFAHKRGADVAYFRLDITDAAAVASAVREIEDQHGRLNGVLHAAGVLDDGLLAGLDDARVRAVLAPKVAGAINLDEATRHLCLDVFALFASVVGVLGNAGQAAYAAANGFLDRFAATRAAQVAAGRRFGRTVAIDWPLWAQGGMRPDEATVARLRAAGLAPLPSAAGLDAFHRAIALDAAQVLVLHGDPSRLAPWLGLPPEAPAQPAAADDDEARLARLLADIQAGVLTSEQFKTLLLA